ncbi:sensor histidine kinase [Streptomyces sp. bgisy032]|uniref:sensor histidine kinase n=1 Tax=Streptomyces sp. bgisy032 TaxID=3413773 RepID=UPI003D703D7F
MPQYDDPGSLALRPHPPTGPRRQPLQPSTDTPTTPTTPAAPPPHEAPRTPRPRLLRAREEERRHLRRELHDGLGPHLAAVQLRLNAAQACAPLPATAAEHLHIAVQALGEALLELRHLTSGTIPPALTGRGLLDATRTLAHHLTSGDVQVIVADPRPPLPTLTPAVETTAYRITAEALTNAVRHAGARRIHVDFRIDLLMLTISVTDDGIGLDPRAATGTGLASIAARAASIGGIATLDTGPHGTAVHIALPLAPARPRQDDHE